jgi:two-component system response regulator YesN
MEAAGGLLPLPCFFTKEGVLFYKGGSFIFRVLIVDDAVLIRNSLRKFVESMGPHVVVAGMASNGVQALQWLEGHYADICITDIRMPRMDGLSLIAEINGQYPWMTSIVVSSYDEFEYARKSIQLCAIDYILKPVEKPLLHQALSQAMEKLDKGKYKEALELQLNFLPQHRRMMDQWLEHIRALKLETLPLLVVDTLELLEQGTGCKLYLLPFLAQVWLSAVAAELAASEKIDIRRRFESPVELGEAILPVEKMRFYFRLCTVRDLEDYVYLFMESRKDAGDQQFSRLIRTVKQYIEEHCYARLSLDEISNHVGLNKNYLSSLFKQETNMTVLQYVVELKLQKAREMLLCTNMKIYEISNKLGYEDIDYFTRLFKKSYGVAPLEYKRRMEQ